MRKSLPALLCLFLLQGCGSSFDSSSAPATQRDQANGLVGERTVGNAPLEVVFRVSPPNPESIVQVEIDFEGDGVFDSFASSTEEANQGILRHTYFSPGRYRAVLRLGDVSGQTTETYQEVVVADNGNIPPLARLSADVASGSAPLAVRFRAEGSDEDGGVTKFEWDFDGDGIYDLDSGTAAGASHSYANGGLYRASLRVTDGGGLQHSATALIEVTRKGNLLPVASLEADRRGGDQVPVDITLDASRSSDADGPLKLYEWDVDGDGTYDEKTAQPKLTYACSFKGQTRPRLRVTDADGATAEASLGGAPIFLERGWTVTTVETYTLGEGFPKELSLVEQTVGGTPFVVGTFMGDLDEVHFLRASAANPTDWTFRFGDLTGVVRGSRPRITVVGELPLVSFTSGGIPGSTGLYRGIYAVTALNPEGSRWPQPVVAAVGNMQEYALATVGDQPALVYSEASGVFYRRRGGARSFTGTPWGFIDGMIEEKIFQGDSNAVNLSLTTVGNRPAVAFSVFSTLNLGVLFFYTTVHFAGANSSDGSGRWNASSEVEGFCLRNSPLAFHEVSSRPAVVYVPDHGGLFDGGNKGCQYERASSNSPISSNWVEGQKQNFAVGSDARFVNLAVRENRPWVVFATRGALRATRGTTASGSSFTPPERVDGSLGTIQTMSMTVAGGKPIVLYVKDIPHPSLFLLTGQIVGRQLKVAVWD